MNKNILLLAGVGVAYWYYRNQQSQHTTSAPTALTTGAASYLPATTVQPTTTTAAAGGAPSWLTNTAGTVATAGNIVKSGVSLWETISGAFNTAKSPIGGVTADGSDGIWAGPTYATS